MSVTKPIGTVQYDAVLLASLCLSAVSVVLCSACNPQHCPWGGKLGMLTAAKLQVAARENNRSLCPCFSHWLEHYTVQQ